jgi:hypothetical protein
MLINSLFNSYRMGICYVYLFLYFNLFELVASKYLTYKHKQELTYPNFIFIIYHDINYH